MAVYGFGKEETDGEGALKIIYSDFDATGITVNAPTDGMKLVGSPVVLTEQADTLIFNDYGSTTSLLADYNAISQILQHSP